MNSFTVVVTVVTVVAAIVSLSLQRLASFIRSFISSIHSCAPRLHCLAHTQNPVKRREAAQAEYMAQQRQRSTSVRGAEGSVLQASGGAGAQQLSITNGQRS